MKKLLCVIFLLLWGQLGFATTVNKLIIFGDSLSDTGNLYEYMDHQMPQTPPYYFGRFSDGPVWVEYLIRDHFHTSSTGKVLNYAFGGAGVLSDSADDDVLFTLNREIDTYLLSHANQADPNALFIVWIGGNNYLSVPENADEVTSQVMEGMQKGLDRLVHAGAKTIMVINLPNLAKTPLARFLDAASQLDTISTLHNDKIVAMVTQLKQTEPNVQWMLFDVNRIFIDLTSRYHEFGFDYLNETCYDTLVPPDTKLNILKIAAATKAKKHQTIKRMRDAASVCDRYFFFDQVHPTTHMHQLTAKYLYDELAQAQIEFIAP